MSGEQHKGRFQKGYDARRKQFTSAECSAAGKKGFQAAWESLERRFPGCDPHFLMCAIIGSKPMHWLLENKPEVFRPTGD